MRVRVWMGPITRIGLSISPSFLHSLIIVLISPRIHSGVYTFVLDTSFCGAFNSIYVSSIHLICGL
jgi:hypothetical protein